MPNISENYRKVTLALLHKLRKEKERRLINGAFIEPGTVYRCDGHTKELHQDTLDETPSAIFACMPYFSIEPLERDTFDPSGSFHPRRTLFQSLLPLRDNRQRDLNQAFCRYSSESSPHIIHVPLIWVLIIGSGELYHSSIVPLIISSHQ